MKRTALLALALLGGCQRRDDFKFADAAIVLPDETAAFPDRPGVAAVTSNCAGCHSPSMILTQPRLKPEQWRAEIDKMKTAYKAPVSLADEPAILAYLTATSDALPR